MLKRRWREYGTGLPDHPTADLYAKAAITTLTHLLARAASPDQRFDGADAFFPAAWANPLKAHTQDWLPPSLRHCVLARVIESCGNGRDSHIQCGRFRAE